MPVLRLSFLACFLFLTAHISLRLIPIPPALLRPPVQSIALLDRNGIPLREARVEERFSRELALDEVPRHVINAVLAAEDKRFYRHHGIDWLATARALGNGLTRWPHHFRGFDDHAAVGEDRATPPPHAADKID